MALLREQTGDLHREVEKRVGILHPELSLSGYVRLLSRFLAAHAAVERHFEAWAGTLPLDLDQRRKVRWLREDLHALDAPLDTPQPATDLRVHSPATLLGTLYVVEGSTLGGQVIARHLGPKLNLTPQRGLRFFTGYGEHTGAMWKAFRAAAEAFGQDHPHTHQTVVAAARDTFSTFNACFARREAP
jgi:heme oxygenase